MRRWLSLATALVFLLCVRGDAREKRFLDHTYHKDLEDCQADNVCLIFSHTKCKIDGKEANNAYVWLTEATTTTKCEGRHYGTVYARLDIQSVSLTSWRVNATLYEKKGDEIVHTPDDYSFDFGNAELKFVGKNETHFTWKRKGSDKEISTKHAVEDNEPVSTVYKNFFDPANWFGDYQYGLGRYSFEVHSKHQKLIGLIGPEVTLKLKEEKFVLNDQAFPEQLSRITKCDASEINEVCYGTCEKIFSDSKSNSNSTNSTGTQDFREPNCPSHLWFHSPSDGAMFRQWKKVEGKLNCYMGWWRPNWTSWDADAPKGSQNLVRTDEVQCSVEKPRKLTTMAQIIFGVSGSILGLLVVAGVVAFVVCFLKRRNSRTHHRHGRTEKTDRKNTIRDSDSRAQTPGTPGGKSTEREKY